MTNIKFNSEEVVVNGVLSGARKFLNEENTSTLKAFMNLHFMMTPKQTILQELHDSEIIEGQWMLGDRTQSNEEILLRMISGLVDYSRKQCDHDNELATIVMNEQVKMFKAKDIINVLEKALANCASADYYYTYEKDWA